ncbi:MAG: hypothetical protein WBL23_00065, partial [Salinisphaera sp.]|uniref:hypothetical protein n=1 Tax=Salinisphaera sp. TaxID=1914330 RepID=UPI003C7C9716
FLKWTLDRARHLPANLLLPLGQSVSVITGCRGWRTVWKAQIPEASDPVYRAAGQLLRRRVAIPDVAGERLFSNASRPKPGPDLLWFYGGDPDKHGASECSYGSGGTGSLKVTAARQGTGYVSAFVSVSKQPLFGNLPTPANAFLYDLMPSTIQIVRRKDAGPGMPPGLDAILVVTSQVDSAKAFHVDQFGGGIKQTADMKKGDWALPTAAKPAATDITGLTVDMPLGTFETKVHKKLPDAVRFTTKVPGKGMLGHAVGFYDVATREMMIGIYADNVDGKPMTAIMRKIPASEVPPEALKQTFVAKYGRHYRTDGDNHWIWGGLPASEDNMDVCGGVTIMSPPDTGKAAELVAEHPKQLPVGASIAQPYAWTQLGWPKDRRAMDTTVDIARCGPVVSAQIYRTKDNLEIITWLTDRTLAGKYDAMPKAIPKMTEKIKL